MVHGLSALSNSIEADESNCEVVDHVIDKEIEEETRVADEESYDGDAVKSCRQDKE